MGKVFVGHDWAEDHHDLFVMDDTGRRLAGGRVADGVDGIARFHEMVADVADDPSDVVIGSETDRGLFVGALVAAGYTVIAVNPMSTSRYRERHSTSGAKSDPGDAKVLADLVRTDAHSHRRVAGDSELGEAVKVLSRAHQSMIWTRQRQTNQLRSVLREFYPAALDAFDDLGSGDAMAVLAIAPTPTTGRRLSVSKIGAALRRGGRQRRIEQKATEIQTALRSDQLASPDLITNAMGATVTALVAVITELNTQIDVLGTSLADRFEQHPDAKIIRSLPGLGMILGARVLGEFGDDPNRYRDAKSRKNYSGMSPITKASGKHHVVLARYARNRRLSDACYLWAFAALTASPGARRSTTNTAPEEPPTTKHSEHSPTVSSGSSTAASNTKPHTTNTPPGHTEPTSPLDNYNRGMSRPTKSRMRPTATSPPVRIAESQTAAQIGVRSSWSRSRARPDSAAVE